MATPHINANLGDFAETVLLPGDPLRAKFIAENFLENAKLVTSVRNMFGYTGEYKGKKISVMGTGMGVPSASIYASELAKFYGVKNLLRIGSCGAVSEDIKLRDIIIASGASTNSNVNKARFGRNVNWAATASYNMLEKAVSASKELGLTNVRVGQVFTSDLFYGGDVNLDQYRKMGILGVEMEAAAIYGVATEENVNALAIVTVSDHIALHQETTAEEREKTFTDMMKIALDASLKF